MRRDAGARRADAEGDDVAVRDPVGACGVNRTLVIRGTELGGADTFQQTFRRTGTSGMPGTSYPSIVDLPHAGCWRLELSTRGFTATVVVLGVDP
jgi:hypothetical protein